MKNRNNGVQELQHFMNCKKIYKPDDIYDVLNKVRNHFTLVYRKNIKYYNVPVSFDIETSSFYENENKKAIMYVWMTCIYGLVIIGRTWDEYLNMLNIIRNELNLSDQKILVIYVHNLSYEFQFMRKHMKWNRVFSIDTRKPCYAVSDGIEFRCSYILSGYSLEKTAEQLHTFNIKKMSGDLDYNLIRHSKTSLTEQETGYCINDVKTVVAYIQECIMDSGNITKIPLTKTGYVRQYIRNRCFYESGKPQRKSYKKLRYTNLMKSMLLKPDEYIQLKRAFQGGFTHANPFYSGKTLENVSSYDFTSSYPAVMVSEKFPMSSAEEYKPQNFDDFIHQLKTYCCLFDVEFNGIESTVFYESYLSAYRCIELEKPVINNGRIVSAKHLVTTITEQDFWIILKLYKWDSIRISNFKRYKRGYLPKDFVSSILELYQNKTKLKGVKGSEIEYQHSKEMINSCYGMSVTDIVREEIIYDDEWDILPPDIETSITKYNKNSGRFLFYPWGVWVTAYARRNLFTGIFEFRDDYIYSDTDSIKVLNKAKHEKYIAEYNDAIINRLETALEIQGFDKKLIKPETIKGIIKPLGVWDYEGTYSKFKTLGAKRYMTEKNNSISITVSGLNKSVCVPYLNDITDNPFDFFDNDLYIPAEYTGKNTHTYIDEAISGTVTDYTGNTDSYYEKSFIHLEQADYSMSISDEYMDYIFSLGGIK